MQVLLPSELQQEHKVNSDELRFKGYLYEGVDASEEVTPEMVVRDRLVMLRNAVVYAGQTQWLDERVIHSLLGEELSQRQQALQHEVADRVQHQSSAWFLNRYRALGGDAIMSHGTGQALIQQKGVARDEQLALNERTTVQAIVHADTMSGVHIANQKATTGAFFESAATNRYGSFETGSMVLFFLDDLLESHIAVSRDVFGADGLVARSAPSDRLEQIPRRVCLNPQAGEIGDIALSDEQMTEYVLQLRSQMLADPDLVNAIEQQLLESVYQQHSEIFDTDLPYLYHQLRADGYTEGAVVASADYYLRLALDLSPEAQQKFSALRKTLRACQAGALTESPRCLWQNIDWTWQAALQQEVTTLTPATRIARQAQEQVVRLQRRALLEALDILEDPQGQEIGVVRQLRLQYDAAVNSGAIDSHSLAETLRLTRSTFLDAMNQDQSVAVLENTRQLADHLTAVKQEVMRQVVSSAVAALEAEDVADYLTFQNMIIWCSTGFVGRGEAVISSDLDYLVIVDDSGLADEDREKIRDVLQAVGQGIN